MYFNYRRPYMTPYPQSAAHLTGAPYGPGQPGFPSYGQPGFMPSFNQYQPYGQAVPPQMLNGSGPSPSSSLKEQLFQNPLQPQYEPPAYAMPGGVEAYVHPYPKHNAVAKQAGGMQTVLNSFKTQSGTLDINKMVNTAGQMMNAMTQFSSMLKGFGGIFKV